MKVVHIKSELRLDPSKKAYQCSICGKVFNWSLDSSWYGSYEDLEETPKGIKYFCSDKCKNEHQIN